MLTPNCRQVLVPAVLWITSFCSATSWVLAEGPAIGFDSILEKQTRAMFQAISDYIVQNPDANDVERAYQWLFESALVHGLEKEALPAAETCLKQKSEGQSSRPLAQMVQCIGLARSGKTEEALAVFEDHLRSVRFRSANTTVDFARTLATRLQMEGELDGARSAYERLSGAFFLNAEVKQMCENKLEKLDLIGNPAPEVDVADLEGNSIKLSNLQGKIILVDFWATNCPPCIEEFPKMKQLYADYHDKGFEVVGISLDDDRQIVDQFQEKWKLPWPIVVNTSEIRRLREIYKVRKIPSTYLVDQQGKITKVDLKSRDVRIALEVLLKAGS